MSEGMYINEDELLKKAITILSEKLGPVETNRFLSLNKRRRTESVKRHKEWQKNLNKENFLKEIFKK